MVRLVDVDVNLYLRVQAESWGSIAHKDMRDAWEGEHVDGCAYDHARKGARFAQWVLDLENDQQNYATVYESAERAEQLWMETQGERDEARDEVKHLKARVAFLEGMLRGAADEMGKVSWAFPKDDGRHARALHLAETWRKEAK